MRTIIVTDCRRLNRILMSQNAGSFIPVIHCWRLISGAFHSHTGAALLNARIKCRTNERTNDMSDDRWIGRWCWRRRTSVTRVILLVLCRNSAEGKSAAFIPPMGRGITAICSRLLCAKYTRVNYCLPPYNCGGFRVNPASHDWNIMSCLILSKHTLNYTHCNAQLI